MTNEQMRTKIASVKQNFGPRNSHMLARQLDGEVSMRTIERWRRIAREFGCDIETRPRSVFIALPLNGVDGKIA